MVNLSVNINKVATLRNARGGNVPNVQNVAIDCERFGADGITVHPRPDERHIKHDDVFALRPLIRTEFNIEGYPSDDFMKLVLLARPSQVTLVPDAPDALTSSAGWVVADHLEFLTGIVDRLKEAGIRLYGGVKGNADKAIEAYLKGNLDYNPEVYCTTHEHGHSCGEHHCGEEKHGCSGNGENQ